MFIKKDRLWGGAINHQYWKTLGLARELELLEFVFARNTGQVLNFPRSALFSRTDAEGELYRISESDQIYHQTK